MKFSIALLSVIAAALANNVDVATVLMNDVQNNMDEYIGLVGGTIPIPPELIDYYAKIATYTDDSYTSILTDFPVDKIKPLVTQLPWYSSRLESKLEVAYTQEHGEAASSATPSTSQSSAAPSSSAAPESSSSAAPVPSSSSDAPVSSSSEAAPSSKASTSQSSSAAPVSSSAEGSSSKASSSTTVVSSVQESSSSVAQVSTYTGGANNLNNYLPLVLASPLLSFLI